MLQFRKQILSLFVLLLMLCGCAADQSIPTDPSTASADISSEELTVTDSPIPLVLSVENAGIAMKQLVDQFNMLHTGYTVTLIVDSQSTPEIIRNIQNGSGADLYQILPPYEAEPLSDYFMPLTDIFTEGINDASSIGFYGRDGQMYGITVCWLPEVLAIAGNRYRIDNDSSVSDLMYAVKVSDAEIFCKGLSGEDIVSWLAELEKADGFIDWNNQKAHFDCEEFYEILSFARKYADDGRFKSEKERDLLKEGKVFCAHGSCMSPAEMYYYDALLGDNAVFRGCYGQNGVGFKSMTSLFTANIRSEHKEGIILFLKYLMSQDGQQVWNDKIMICGMPIQAMVQEQMIHYAKEDRFYPEMESNGIHYYPQKLDSFHETQLKNLLSGCEVPDQKAAQIYGGLPSVLHPYFEGHLTEAQTAIAVNRYVEAILNK